MSFCQQSVKIPAPQVLCLPDFQDGEDDDDQSLLANEQRREQMMAEQEMLDSEVAYLQEREEQIRNLEVSMHRLKF